MKSPYYPAEIKSAMSLKSLSTIDIANQMSISRRMLDYFIKGQMKMNRSEEFINIFIEASLVLKLPHWIE